MATAKTKTKTQAMTMDSYLEATPQPARGTLEKVRKMIRKVVPEAEETISYGVPAFKQGGVVAGFAATKTHCALYLFSGTVVEALADALEGYEISKGTVRFPLDKPLPEALIRKLVQARQAEIQAKKS